MSNSFTNRRREIRDTGFTMSLAFGFIGTVTGLAAGAVLLILVPTIHLIIYAAVMLVSPVGMMFLGMKFAWFIEDRKISALNQEEDHWWGKVMDYQMWDIERQSWHHEVIQNLHDHLAQEPEDNNPSSAN